MLDHLHRKEGPFDAVCLLIRRQGSLNQPKTLTRCSVATAAHHMKSLPLHMAKRIISFCFHNEDSIFSFELSKIWCIQDLTAG
jgi:hypothetical protein